MQRLATYIRVWKQIIWLSNSSAVVYRVDYILRIFRAIQDVGISVIVINILFHHSPIIAGWNQWEALTAYAFFQIVRSGVYALAGYGINELHEDILRGQIDRYLIQPIDSQFSASTRVTFVTSIFRSLLAFAVLWYSAAQLKLEPTFIQITLSFLSTISSLLIFYSFLFAASITSFWTFSGELWQMIENIATINRYPMDFFAKGVQILFHVIPLAFIATVPAKALLGRGQLLALLSPLVAAAMFILTRKLWHAGLRSYQSVSS